MNLVNENNNNNLTWSGMNKERAQLIRDQLELQRLEHVKLSSEHQKHADFFANILRLFKIEDVSKNTGDYIEDYIYQILEKHRTIKTKDIVHYIEDMPIHIESKNLYNLVQSVLRDNDKFVKVKRGMWSIKQI